MEARYHHQAAGQIHEAVALSAEIVSQLDTWGQYGREAELCRETLSWLPSDSEKAAAFKHQLGITAHRRGDYKTAESHYRQALEIDERLGNLVGMATIYHNLGNLAYLRGDYDTAKSRFRQSLEINELLGNQAGLASNYGHLGMLAQDRGDYDTAEFRYGQALEIFEHLGDQAGMATSSSALAVVYAERDQYREAIRYEVHALAIWLGIGLPQATGNIERLSKLCAKLGKEPLLAAVNELTDEESAQKIMDLLDEAERPDR